uniref:Uncharacterized protein n=1 Tax=Arundo donax TaxID=35708 RepID=A0A0A9C696_ARUDO
MLPASFSRSLRCGVAGVFVGVRLR